MWPNPQETAYLMGNFIFVQVFLNLEWSDKIGKNVDLTCCPGAFQSETEFYFKLHYVFQTSSVISRSDKKLFQRVGDIKCDNYFKVWQHIQTITWDRFRDVVANF